MSKRGAWVGLVVLLGVLFVRAPEARAQGKGSLLSSSYGIQLGGRPETSFTSSAGVERGTLDVGVVAALIEERAKALGLRATAHAMRKVVGTGSERLDAMLEQGAALLGSTAGAKSAEALVRTLVNVALAEGLVGELGAGALAKLEACKKGADRTDLLFSILQAKGPFAVASATPPACADALLKELGVTTAVALVGRDKKPSLALVWELGGWDGKSVATVGEGAADLDTKPVLAALEDWKSNAAALQSQAAAKAALATISPPADGQSREAATDRAREANHAVEKLGLAACVSVEKGLGAVEVEALVRQLRALSPAGERGVGSEGAGAKFVEVGELSIATARTRADQLSEAARGLRELVKVLDQAPDCPKHPLLSHRARLLALAATSVRLQMLLDELTSLAEVGELFQPTVGEVASLAKQLAPVLTALRPLLSFKLAVGARGELPLEAALRLLADVGTAELVRATGFKGSAEECREGRAPGGGATTAKGPTPAQRWACTVVSAITDSLTVSGGKVQFDATTATKRLARLGDSMRAASAWRPFFHLTVGTGVMFAPNVPTPGGALRQDRWSPLVAEQIGVGVASPACLDDAVTFKTGAFVSGILYRAVVDSVESDAFHVGGFLAADLYDLLELHVSPSLMVNPALGDSSLGFGLVFGAQVPLGDFLSRL